jgi:hypothetical protein
MTQRRRRILTGVAALGGVALFAVAVERVGLAAIADGIRRVGWPGVLAMLVIAGLRFVLRTASWRLCMPPYSRLSFGQAFAAFLAGDALGNVTPLGMLASEPAKVFLARHRLATTEAVASLALDNLVYAGSAVAMIAVGLVVALAIVPLSVLWQGVAFAGLSVAAAAVVVGLRLMRGTWTEGRGDRPVWRQRVSSVRASVVRFVAEQPGRLPRVIAVDATFHVLAVVEVYVVLRGLLGDGRPTVAQAIVFEALNRLVTVAFKFVPFRVGVDEAFSGALAPLITVDPLAGVTLAVLRKARNLFWTAVGLALIGAAPAPGARASLLGTAEGPRP